MRDYAPKSYRRSQSTGLVLLVAILSVLFMAATWLAFENLKHVQEPMKYKWLDKSGTIQCMVRVEENGPLVPCQTLPREELDTYRLEWANPNRSNVKA